MVGPAVATLTADEIDLMVTKPKKPKLFDAAMYLDSEGAIAEYISEALLTGDADTISHAFATAEKARRRLHQR